VTAGLLFVVGAGLFGGAGFGAATALLFLTTPIVWYAQQTAPHALYPLPFVAGWLAAVARFQPGATWGPPAAAGVALGLGLLTTPAAFVMMPVYLALTIAMAFYARSLDVRRLGVLVAGFLVAASPAIVSLVRHPEDFRAMVSAYRLYDAQRFNVLQGVREMISWVGLTARTEVYYDFFNPAFLFLTGRVLLFPLVVLLPIGLWQLLTKESSLMARLTLLGFLLAPFAASLTAEAPTPGRILFLTPFAALASTYALRHLLTLIR
jgi:hypothetical protein